MRRTRSTPVLSNSRIYSPVLVAGPWVPPSVTGTITVSNPEYDSFFEMIESREGQQNWNPCQHYKAGRNVTGANVVYASSNTHSPSGSGPYFVYTIADKPFLWGEFGGGGSSSAIGTWQSPLNGLPSLYDGHDIPGFASGISGLMSLIDASLMSMLPGIRPNLSIVNSIIELKDFKSLPRTIGKMQGVLVALKRFIRSPLARGGKARGLSLRRIFGSTADGYLQQQFNLLPLLSDVNGVINATRETRQAIARLLAEEGKNKTSHFLRSLGNIFTDFDSTVVIPKAQYYSGAIDGDIEYYRSVKYLSPMFHAMLEYDYNLTQWERENALVLGMLDSIGLNNNPAIIWNAIPWSFVVDWVLGVNRWLDQLKRRNIEPTTRLRRYLYSIKVRRVTSLSMRVGKGSPYRDSGVVPFAGLDETSYLRMPYRPDVMRAITSSGLSPKEFSLGAALVLSR